MRLGALLAPLFDASEPRALAEQARMFANEGFRSLWSAQAVGRGFMMTDPFIALTIAATVTEKVEIGTAVLQVPLYQPIDLAHRVISLQQVCGSRLLLGVGAGSTEKDFLAFDRDYNARFTTFTQNMSILRGALQSGRADGIDLSPWPPVQGAPPLLLGSWGAGVARAARGYDGWINSPTRVSTMLSSSCCRVRHPPARCAHCCRSSPLN